jgi:uncharacterized SAM-binding protein YcdF (DUF218 family)
MARLLKRLGIACTVIIVVAVVAYIFREPILRGIGHQLVYADEPAASDAILVLAGGVLDRELQTATLFKAGYAPRVLMTREQEPRVIEVLRGRGVRFEAPLEMRRRVLTELGVPADRIQVLEPIVRSTFDEARAARQWAEQHRATRLTVVTSSFHTARSRYVFLNVFTGSPTALTFIPAAESDFRPDSWWARRDTLRDGLIEWQKTVFYRLRY